MQEEQELLNAVCVSQTHIYDLRKRVGSNSTHGNRDESSSESDLSPREKARILREIEDIERERSELEEELKSLMASKSSNSLSEFGRNAVIGLPYEIHEISSFADSPSDLIEKLGNLHRRLRGIRAELRDDLGD